MPSRLLARRSPSSELNGVRTRAVRTPGQSHRLAYEVGRFRRHLAAAGHSDAAINIGLPELRGKDPAVIAVGVAAQVIVAMAGASTFRL